MILSNLVLGFVTSYIGYMSPSMLNITASKIRLEKSKSEAHKFILGVLLIVVLQLFVSISLMSFLNKYPELIAYLKKFAAIVFFILSIVFIKKGLTKKTSENRVYIEDSFSLGMVLSLINIFAIPFFIVEYKFFLMYGWLMKTTSSTIFFGLGSVLGVFLVLSSYVFLVNKFENNLLRVTKYFNVFIGIVMGLVALYSFLISYF